MAPSTLKSHIPNALTVGRVALSPLFIGLFLLNSAAGRIAALTLVVVFELTDLLDGYLARRWKVVSEFGKWFDPMADKITHFAVFFAFLTEPFVQHARWVVFLVFALFFRDTIVTYMRIRCAREGIVVPARFSGKLKTVVQSVGIFIYLIFRTLVPWKPDLAASLPAVFYWVMFLMVVTSLASLVDYVAAYRENRDSHLFPGGNR